jgi:hypothetical protein
MTCAKRVVTCTIFSAGGSSVSARNDCLNPQEVCPREYGEGYEKCRTVCQQQGHAEVQALSRARQVGLNIAGGHALIEGHYHACQLCCDMLQRAGVSRITIFLPDL